MSTFRHKRRKAQSPGAAVFSAHPASLILCCAHRLETVTGWAEEEKHDSAGIAIECRSWVPLGNVAQPCQFAVIDWDTRIIRTPEICKFSQTWNLPVPHEVWICLQQRLILDLIDHILCHDKCIIFFSFRRWRNLQYEFLRLFLERHVHYPYPAHKIALTPQHSRHGQQQTCMRRGFPEACTGLILFLITPAVSFAKHEVSACSQFAKHNVSAGLPQPFSSMQQKKKMPTFCLLVLFLELLIWKLWCVVSELWERHVRCQCRCFMYQGKRI